MDGSRRLSASGLPPSGGDDYVRRLEEKIRRQAEELSHLAQLEADVETMRAYIGVCEARVLDLVPDHPLPIDASHIGIPAETMGARGHGAAAASTNLSRSLLPRNLSSMASPHRGSGSPMRGKDRADTGRHVAKLESRLQAAEDKMQMQMGVIRELRGQVETKERELKMVRRTEHRLSNLNASQAAATNASVVAELDAERDELYSTLNAEGVVNEEQRAYIQVLLNALDKKGMTLGLGQGQGLSLAKFSAMQDSYHRARDEADLLRKELDMFKRADDGPAVSRVQYEQLEGEKAALLDYVEDAQGERQQLMVTLAEVRNELETMTGERERLRTELANAMEENERVATDEKERLDLQLEELQSIQEELLTALRTAKMDAQKADEACTEAESRASELETRAATAEAERDEVREELNRAVLSADVIKSSLTQDMVAQRQSTASLEQDARSAREDAEHWERLHGELAAVSQRAQDELAAAKSRLQELEAQMSHEHELAETGHATAASLAAERDELASAKQALEADVAATEEQRTTLAAKVQELEAVLRTHLEQLEARDAELVQVREELDGSRQEKAMMRKSVQDEVHGLHVQMEETARELRAERARASEEEKRLVAEREEIVDQVTSELDTTRRELERSQGEMARLMGLLQASNEKVARLTTVANTVEDVQRAKDACDARIGELESDADQQRMQLALYYEKTQALAGDLEASRGRVADLEAIQSETQARLARAEASASGLENRTLVQTTANAALQASVNELSSRVASFEELQAENAALRRGLSALETDRTRLSHGLEETEELRDKLHRTEQRLAIAERERASLETVMGDREEQASGEVSRLYAALREAEQATSEATAKLSEVLRTQDEANSTCQVLMAAKAQVETELAELRNDYETRFEDHAALQFEVTRLATELDEAQQARAELQAKVAHLVDEKAHHVHDMVTLQSENATLGEIVRRGVEAGGNAAAPLGEPDNVSKSLTYEDTPAEARVKMNAEARAKSSVPSTPTRSTTGHIPAMAISPVPAGVIDRYTSPSRAVRASLSRTPLHSSFSAVLPPRGGTTSDASTAPTRLNASLGGASILGGGGNDSALDDKLRKVQSDFAAIRAKLLSTSK